MKLVTWNLERGRNSRRIVDLQREVLASVEADVEVLTEVPSDVVPDLVAGSELERVGRRGSESWVGIVGPAVDKVERVRTQAPLAAAAFAASGSRRFLIYGSVLPWAAARKQFPELVDGESKAVHLFNRVLDEQVDDLVRLRQATPDAVVIWAGDFNQTLKGPNWGGSKFQRLLLEDALDQLELVAWNADLPHAKEGMCAIDLICGPADVQPIRVERFVPLADGRILSDHAGYWIEL